MFSVWLLADLGINPCPRWRERRMVAKSACLTKRVKLPQKLQVDFIRLCVIDRNSYLVTCWLIWKDPDAGKDWGQEEKGTTEDETAGWHHWHEFGWTPGVGDGHGGLVCCDSWGRKESDMTEQLNWTQLQENLAKMVISFSSLCRVRRQGRRE